MDDRLDQDFDRSGMAWIEHNAEKSDEPTLPLVLEGVRKTYESRQGPVNALENIDLAITPGEFVSVVGPSGCGKTTMMMIAAGLIRPSAGNVRVGHQIIDGPFTDVGIVFQDAVLLDWRRALGNVMLQIEMRGLDKAKFRPRAMELLRLVNLQGFENRYPYELSGGMRQRVALCRALVHDPPILLMDEPFGALDALTRDQLKLDLQRIWMNSRKTVLFITHSVPESVFLSDRVIVMSDRPGRIAADIRVGLGRPRALESRDSEEFSALTGQIYEILASLGILREDRDEGGGLRMSQ